jgi:hypothetical protein
MNSFTNVGMLMKCFQVSSFYSLAHEVQISIESKSVTPRLKAGAERP